MGMALVNCTRLSWIHLAQFRNRETIDPGWVQTGKPLKGFWERAVLIPKPLPARHFICDTVLFCRLYLDSGSYTWFSKLVVAGGDSWSVSLLF